MKQTPKNIVIVGAGLVGCALAVAMQKLGHKVSIFEKRSDLRNTEGSAGRSINLIVTTKGLHTLQKLELKEKVLKITSPVLGRMMHAMDKKLTYQPYGKDESEKNYSVSRGELNATLLDAAEELGVGIYFENELISIDFENKTAQFGSETKAFDLIFGADGAGSKTRHCLSQKLGASMHEEVQDLGVCYKELFLPAQDGKYAIDQKALHIWPRGEHFLMALPNQGGSFTMTLYMPPSYFERMKTKDDVEKYFQENYPDTMSLMPNYQVDFFENPTGKLGTLRASAWIYQDELCLVGDAAHAIVPFFGQGMNCGLTDVNYLLEKCQEHGDDWQRIFQEYQEHQKLNGDAIADMSIENYREMSEKVGDEKFLMRKKVDQLLETKFPKKWKPRYGQVVYTLTPYHICQANGKIQGEILDKLCENIKTVNQVNLNKAKELIQKKL